MVCRATWTRHIRIALGRLGINHPKATEICPQCNQKVVFWFMYNGDTLFGVKVKLPGNKCIQVCSECGNEVREETISKGLKESECQKLYLPEVR